MTQELCSFCLNQSCQSTSPPHTSPFIGSAGISGTSKMCIQIRYLRDLQFCAAPVQQCIPQYVQTPCLQSFLSCFQGPLSAICFFFEVLVTGRIFPDFPLTTLTFFVWFFSSTGLLEDELTAVGGLVPISFLPLRVICSCSDLSVTECVCCVAVLSEISAEVSYTCRIATGQMPRPYALSPYLDTAGNLRVSLLFHLFLKGCFGKTLPWSLWCSSSPSAALLVACPVQNNVEISLNCCIFFFFFWSSITGMEKAFLLGSRFDSLKACSLC